jgi:hypothetical protein
MSSNWNLDVQRTCILSQAAALLLWSEAKRMVVR